MWFSLDCFCSQIAIDSNRKFTLVSLFGKNVNEITWNFRSFATITAHTYSLTTTTKTSLLFHLSLSLTLFFTDDEFWIDFYTKMRIIYRKLVKMSTLFFVWRICCCCCCCCCFVSNSSCKKPSIHYVRHALFRTSFWSLSRLLLFFALHSNTDDRQRNIKQQQRIKSQISNGINTLLLLLCCY